jgi:hypothetical protein
LVIPGRLGKLIMIIISYRQMRIPKRGIPAYLSCHPPVSP